MNNPQTLLVVIPVHNEKEILRTTILDIIQKIKTLEIDFSIVIVDDGSTDSSWQEIKILAEDQPELILGVKLSRNYGKDAAILAGLECAPSDLYLVIDADGEHPTEKILEFHSTYLDGDCDAVHGIKKKRRGSRRGIFFSRMFNRIFNLLTSIDLAESSDYKLFNKKFRDALIGYGDYDYFFRAAAQDVGFQTKTLEFDEKIRVHGTSSWSSAKLIKYALDSVLNYSHYPLFLILFFGVFSVGMGLLIGIKALFDALNGNVPEGYLTLLILSLLSLGIIMTSIGIIGVYLSKIFDEVKGRPRYLINNSINLKGS